MEDQNVPPRGGIRDESRASRARDVRNREDGERPVRKVEASRLPFDHVAGGATRPLCCACLVSILALTPFADEVTRALRHAYGSTECGGAASPGGDRAPLPGCPRVLPTLQLRANFLAEVIQAATLGQGTRGAWWARWVDAVDPHGPPAAACHGDFIPRGATTVLLGTPRLILVAEATGRRPAQITTYGIVRLDADGTLRATTIRAADSSPGWAVGLRDRTLHLLQGLV
ncbi:MAG: hypothetical protein NVSMB65_18100 [Chloroflexota bacterium]